MDAINDVGRLKKNLAEQLISDCNKELINLEGSTIRKLSVIYKPNFSEKDFNDLNEKAKNDSQKREVTIKREDVSVVINMDMFIIKKSILN